MKNAVKTFFQEAWLQYKAGHAQLNIEELVLYQLGFQLITLIYYCVIARYGFNTTDLTTWVVGNALLLCNSTCIFTLGMTFASERWLGRLKTLIVSPCSKFGFIFQKGFFYMFEGFLLSAFGLVMGSLIFGVSFAGVNIPLLIICMLAGMFAASAFGIFAGSFALVSDSEQLILNTTYVSLMILCGANFPVSQLPAAARFASKLLPLSRSIEAANMLFGDFEAARLLSLLAQELLVGVVYMALSYAALRIAERVAVKKASLEMF